ncbi:VCBS repeat-containing protein [Microvirga lupini]|uniref:VCBS repeat-containing protein n=1 Tax=Microvirga lupini TaxID=420324 RepID=A0A7W4YVC0_9HYPH|nr:Ig-like domain-containing protein [Microvirga lupini]MBB3017059.1 VCBS repeat-containing protein [Microvirga lupini]
MGAAAALESIGRVEKASGSVTVLRNGVSIALRLGDAVAKGDVLQTGPSSALTIKFNDGTVFTLSSSARMVLNDMVYSADSNANSALLTLVQGVIGFVAGRVAKTGDLRIDTPVATMAIRGTAVQTEIAAASGTTRFSLLTEPDGSVGSIILLDKNNPSRVIASMSDARVATLLTPVSGSEPRVTQITKTNDEIRGEGDFVRDLYRFFSPEPRQRRGSSDPDDALIVPVNLPQPVDLLDPSKFFVAPPSLESASSRNVIPPSPITTPAPIRGAAVEDGPVARLGTLPASNVSDSGTPPRVIVPNSLPPGVTYLSGARSFRLDPTHPAYQHLGVGETQSVTVDYVLVFNGDTDVPVSVTWVVDGRNDAPLARDDRIGAVAEDGRTVAVVLANDRDIDGDALRLVRWTAPSEGSVSLDAKGNLVFDPGSRFKALSAGETATVEFTYTVSDGNGGTDTATVTLQVRGEGTFTSPHQIVLDTEILEFNQQTVSLSVDAPTATTAATADLELIIGLGPVLQPQMNIVYLIDISGSTSDRFEGATVGDLNGDGRSNTILDAEIAGLIALTERVRGLGFSSSDVTVTIIPFNGSADPADSGEPGQIGVNAATFNLGQAGDGAIATYLRGLDADGETNFANALQAANHRLQNLDQGGEANFLYFLSDGRWQGSVDAEIATLTDQFGATITALGVGDNADLSQLDDIDNTGGASLLISPEQIDVSVLGSPLPSGTITDVDVFVNGRNIAEIGREDLILTPQGWILNASIDGLRRLAGDQNAVSATVKFDSGEVLVAGLTIAGALPRSTDGIL